jgi:hypothetical protein
MPKIDISSWGEFRIGDYFKVEYGKFRPKEELGKGDFNYVTTSGFNNGITDKIDSPDHMGKCITVASDGAMGSAFYQENPFSTSNIVSTLTPFETTPLNKYNALFLCTLIFSKRGEFGWLGYKFSVDRVRNLKLKLPTDSKGNPDWQYMEDYMRNIEVRVSDSISKLESAKDVENSKIDVSSWGEFELRKLFGDCKKGSRLVQAERIDGDVPLVTAGYENVGITSNIGNANMQVFKDCISIDMFGNCFYRDYKFNADDNVLIFAENIKNKYVSMYIAGVVGKATSGYDYTNQYRINNYNRQEIKLPTTSSGEPDWQYMEEYMKNIESKVKRKIDMLIQI